MSGSDRARDVDPQRPSKVWRILLVVVVAGLVGLLIWWAWLPSRLSEGGGNLLEVANQTDEPITIIQLGDDGVRTEVAEIPAHTTLETILACASEELMAVDRQGAKISRRPASEECNLTTWVIGAGSP